MAVSVSQGDEDRRSPQTNAIVLDFTTIKAFFSAITSQLQGKITLDTIRPIHMFMGLSGHNLCFSPEAFAPPVKKLDKSTPEKFKSRLKLNFSFFLSNYAIIVAMVALVIALLHPGMIAWLLFLWGLWGFHAFLISNEVIFYGKNIGTLVSISHRSNALALVTVVIIVCKCLWPAITVVTISSLLVCSHAVMRDPKHTETSNSFGHRHRKEGDDDDSNDSGHGSEVMVDRPMV